MPFSSVIFLFGFLPTFLVVYALTPNRFRNAIALLASLSFYAWGAPRFPTSHAWLGVLAYTLQIYFDFSGYSDMAIGLGMMMGFSFKENFEAPYTASSITDFWRRWHISLSSWLRDCLYIPLVHPLRCCQ